MIAATGESKTNVCRMSVSCARTDDAYVRVQTCVYKNYMSLQLFEFGLSDGQSISIIYVSGRRQRMLQVRKLRFGLCRGHWRGRYYLDYIQVMYDISQDLRADLAEEEDIRL